MIDPKHVFAHRNYCRFYMCARGQWTCTCWQGAIVVWRHSWGNFMLNFSAERLKSPPPSQKKWSKAQMTRSLTIRRKDSRVKKCHFLLSNFVLAKRETRCITLTHLSVQALLKQEKGKQGKKKADKFQLSINSIRASEIGLVRMKQCDRPKEVRRQVYPITAQQ